MTLSSNTVQRLQTIVQKDINAKHIFRVLTKRARMRKETDLYRVRLELGRGGIRVEYDELLDLFESFERLGIGKLTRRTLPEHSVFSWKYILHDVVKAALGSKTPADEDEAPVAEGRAPKGFQRVLCMVRGKVVPLHLPDDFNMSDAKQLGEFLAAVARDNEAR